MRLRRWSDGDEKIAKLSELQRLLALGELAVVTTPATTDQAIDILTRNDAERAYVRALPTDGKSLAQIQMLLVRRRWLDALASYGYRGAKAGDLWDMDLRSIEMKFQLPRVSPNTLEVWMALGEQGGAALIPAYNLRGGKGHGRIHSVLEQFYLESISSARQAAIPLRPASIHSDVMSRVEANNTAFEKAHQMNLSGEASGVENPPAGLVVPPSASTSTRRFLAMVTPYERDVARMGKGRADKHHAPTGARITAELPGLVTEFDDLDTKVFVVSKLTGLGWGRPWLTAGVDQRSSFPVGASWSNKPRSATSAINALVHSILPKDMTALGLGETGLCWEAFGYPTQSVFDNALFNGERFVSLGTDVSDPGWARPYQPRDKREIEFLNRESVAFFKTLPGWRGDLNDPEALKLGLKTATMDDDDFRYRFFKWLLGVYADAPMTDGLSRRQKYLQTGELSLRAKLPPDPNRLRLLAAVPYRDAVIWNSGGIRILGLQFQSEALYARWIRTPGGQIRVHVRIASEDLRQLFVEIPGQSTYLVLPCLNLDYVLGMNLYQQKLVLKMCRVKKVTNPAIRDMYIVRAELAKMTTQLRRSHKVSQRRMAERTGDLPAGAAPPAGTELITEAEKEYRELDEVEMVTEDAGWIDG